MLLIITRVVVVLCAVGSYYLFAWLWNDHIAAAVGAVVLWVAWVER